MSNSAEATTERLELGQWLLLLSAVLVVAVPWWLGLLWLCGILR